MCTRRMIGRNASYNDPFVFCVCLCRFVFPYSFIVIDNVCECVGERDGEMETYIRSGADHHVRYFYAV